MDPSLKIGFIGAGNMAQAIGISIIKKSKYNEPMNSHFPSFKHFFVTETYNFPELVTPGQIYVSAPSARNFEKWNELEVNTTHDNSTCPIAHFFFFFNNHSDTGKPVF